MILDLPPLPKPEGRIRKDDPMGMMGTPHWYVDGYSAEQMRQFWDAGRRAGLEEAAKRTAEAEREDEAEGRGACGGTGRAKP